MSANQFLPASFVEHVERLALGVEPTDPMRGLRIARPLQVMLDGIPTPLPRRLRPPGTGPFDMPDALARLRRRNSCRFALLYRSGLTGPVALRLLDGSEHYVPRRLSITLPDPVAGGRVCRPALYPGAAYDVVRSMPAVRGRVLRGDAPLRWARVLAQRLSDGVPVGVAHGDQHGEFLLLLDPGLVVGPALTPPLKVRVTVYGPAIAPDPAADPASALDPLWDLPLEAVDLTADGDEVLAGTKLPPGYVSHPGSSKDVVIGLELFAREEFLFS